MEQNNLELMQLMIDDHRARLRASYEPRVRHLAQREPSRIRMTCGRMLIQLGERVRGAQPATSEASASTPRLATR